MKLFNVIIFTSIILTTFNARGQSKQVESTSVAEATQAISRSNASYFESFVKNDVSIFVDHYAKDACILAPNAKTMCGKEAITEFFKSAYVSGLRNGKFTTTAIYGSGSEFVVEEGLWQSFDSTGTLSDDGKFLVLWKKTAEGWKMFRDSFSSNRVAAR